MCFSHYQKQLSFFASPTVISVLMRRIYNGFWVLYAFFINFYYYFHFTEGSGSTIGDVSLRLASETPYRLHDLLYILVYKLIVNYENI